MSPRRPISLIIFAIAIALALTACSDDVGGGDDDGWNIGEPNGDECPSEDDFTGHFQPTECMDGDPPVGVCPEAEGYFSIYIEGCGCYCDYDPSGVEPTPEPIICPEDDDGEKYDPTLQPAECAPGGGVQCPDVEGSFGLEIDDCGCYCGYEQPTQPECPTEDDGYHYVSEDPDECAAIVFSCESHQDYFFDEDCGCGCVDVDEPHDCTAQDAAGEGMCDMILGYAFDGQACTQLGGCDCVGTDCDQLYDTLAECRADYEHCTDNGSGTDPMPEPGPTCSAWDVETVGPCDEELGFGYDGEQCVSFSGCNCTGNDCHRLTDHLEDCEKQIRDCDYTCGNPDGVVCDVYMSIDPTTCPDGSAYTVMDCQPMCVDPDTCERLDADTGGL